MTFAETMAVLEGRGSAQTRKTYLRHGASDSVFGVKFGDLYPLARRIGTDQALAEEPWASGNVDALLLACLVVDPAAIGEDELDAWLAGPSSLVARMRQPGCRLVRICR